MDTAVLIAVSACLVASTAGLAMAAPRGAGSAILAQGSRPRRVTGILSWAGLAATLWWMGAWFGWEIAVPAWLGLLSAAGIASLFIAALSPLWLSRCAVATIVLAVVAGAFGISGGHP